MDRILDLSGLDERHVRDLASFLAERPAVQLKTAIIPRIAQMPWAKT